MSDLTLEIADRVAVLRMAHGAENRFHPDFVAELLAALDELEADDRAGALVFTGADPKFFCNGLDLEWMMAHARDLDAILDYLGRVNALYRRVVLFPKPTIAALNGHTFAAGLFLACHMDFRFMREDRGWACMPEVDINIPLLPGMIAACQSVMSASGFRRMYYSGERLGASEAREIGLIDGAFPEDQLLPRSVEFAAMLAGKRTDTYAEMKRRLRADVVRILDEEDPPAMLPTLRHALGLGG